MHCCVGEALSQDFPAGAAMNGPMLPFKDKPKNLAAPLPQTITLEQEMLGDTARVEVTHLTRSTCTPTTGN